jgi:hypothetical protein
LNDIQINYKASLKIHHRNLSKIIMRELNENYDFEEWESDAVFVENEDWIALLKLRQNIASKRPNDLYAQQRYSEALIFNKKFQDAIDVLTPLYHDNYKDGFGVVEIIQALIGLGKTENDYNWIIKPRILKLDKNTLDLCIVFMKSKDNFIKFYDLYEYLMLDADCLLFEDEELLEFLIEESGVFEFIGDISFCFDVKLKLKR